MFPLCWGVSGELWRMTRSISPCSRCSHVAGSAVYVYITYLSHIHLFPPDSLFFILIHTFLRVSLPPSVRPFPFSPFSFRFACPVRFAPAVITRFPPPWTFCSSRVFDFALGHIALDCVYSVRPRLVSRRLIALHTASHACDVISLSLHPCIRISRL